MLFRSGDKLNAAEQPDAARLAHQRMTFERLEPRLEDRRDRPHMYGLTGIQRPLIPRDCRWEVDERMDYQGNVLIPLRARQVRDLAQVLKGEKVDAVVVSLLHSYANPAHEEEIRDILHEVEPAWEIVISSGVIREYYEFERTSTAVIQGYLQPLVSRYAKNLLAKLGDWGFDKQTLIMQSNGGVVLPSWLTGTTPPFDCMISVCLSKPQSPSFASRFLA